VTANQDLARRARDLAARAADGSEDRKVYGCVAVSLLTTSTPAAARKVLSQDCPDVVKAAALAALDQLTRSQQPEGTL
jgi:hypothetical protein